MIREYFKSLEKLPENASLDLVEVIDQLALNEQGLLPVITQDARSKEVLMFAWMNLEALKLTINTKKMTYWSRSRNQLWVKGETSGHTQALVSMSFDCDGDAILCEVNQEGAACHTGRNDCFYLNVDLNEQCIVIASTTPNAHK